MPKRANTDPMADAQEEPTTTAISEMGTAASVMRRSRLRSSGKALYRGMRIRRQ